MLLVCALGYFIDIFDIQLLAVLRVASLTELGVAPDRLAKVGGYILNAQMFGMILGAFLWGWIGDRYGRLRALYGSIAVYSLGTFACGFASDPVTYGVLRFLTGFGLAGETGAATTLAAEIFAPSKRIFAIVIIGGVGFLGPVTAILLSDIFGWRETYIIAGVLGTALLGLRMRLLDSTLFTRLVPQRDRPGSLVLLANKRQLVIVLCCVLMGLPLIFSWNLLNFFSLEISRATLMAGETFNQRYCLSLFYIGACCGDVLSGLVAWYWKSARRAMVVCYVLGAAVGLGYLLNGPMNTLTTAQVYAIYLLLGITAGCWVLMTLIFAEHFGTNIRATTAIVLTNLVRGLSIPTIFLFQWLNGFVSITAAAAITGGMFYIVAFLALTRLRETYGTDLDYVERLVHSSLATDPSAGPDVNARSRM
jgi:predicted MFS family arabinose efflux permease